MTFAYGKELANLGQKAARLLEGVEDTRRPDFFLASICQKRWKPRIAVVCAVGEVAGLVYLKERKVFGIPTGIFFGDGTQGRLVISRPREETAILAVAVRRLLRQTGVHALRMMASPEAFELETIQAEAGASRFDVQRAPLKHHTVLELLKPMTSFSQVSARADGATCVITQAIGGGKERIFENIRIDEFRRAAEKLLEERVVGAARAGVNRALSMFSAADRPLLAGLRDRQGECISILGGWFESGKAIVFFQMNSDRKHARASLCLVTRSYVLESLIARGIRSVVFWAGVGGPIGEHTHALPAMAVHFDSRGAGWRMVRWSIGKCRNKIPGPLRFFNDWIAPPATGAVTGSALEPANQRM